LTVDVDFVTELTQAYTNSVIKTFDEVI